MPGQGDEALLRADVPGIHVLCAAHAKENVDGRDKSGHDEEWLRLRLTTRRAARPLSRLRGRAGWGCPTGASLKRVSPTRRALRARRPPPQAGEVSAATVRDTLPAGDEPLPTALLLHQRALAFGEGPSGFCGRKRRVAFVIIPRIIRFVRL